MSPISLPDITDRLTARTRRYCDRANSLSQDPSLTMDSAAHALDHLAALQADIATLRHRQSKAVRAQQRQVEDPFTRLEAALGEAREELSNALLHAVPDEARLYGPLRHGPIARNASRAVQQNPAVGQTSPSKPAPFGEANAISASRALLDLEALRPYLSDTALRDAIDRYSKEAGHCDVTGVAYAALPTSANLPCAVY